MADFLESTPEGLPQENAFMKKYLSLRNKCEQLQQSNEKLVNRLHHVKKLVKRYKRERRFLTARLDSYSDNYKEAMIPVMWEEDQMYNLLKPPPNSPPLQDIASPPSITTPPPPAPAPTKSKSSKKIKSLLKSTEQAAASSGHAAPSGPAASSGPATSIGPASRIGSLQPALVSHSVKKTYSMADNKKRVNEVFLMFCEQYKHVIQNDYIREKKEMVSQHELTKRLALKWNSLIPEEKKVYYDMYETERQHVDIETHPAEVTVDNLASESALAAMQLESDAAVSSLLNPQF